MDIRCSYMSALCHRASRGFYHSELNQCGQACVEREIVDNVYHRSYTHEDQTLAVVKVQVVLH